MLALARSALLAGLLAGLPGCVAGLIYTDVVVPLDLHDHDTPVEGKTGRSDWKTFSFYVQFDWDSAGIADAARKGGITTIEYADMEIFSILGIWTQRTAIVYGTGP